MNGETRSSFLMTEPAVASSDASNIETSIVRDGDEYVINGASGSRPARAIRAARSTS
jgi:alkylation response protein AidB-like acyl-CoA dehydrogenase